MLAPVVQSREDHDEDSQLSLKQVTAILQEVRWILHTRGIHACRPSTPRFCPQLQSSPALQAAWERLHTGYWKDVPLAWRGAYALACIMASMPACLPEAPPAAIPPAEPCCAQPCNGGTVEAAACAHSSGSSGGARQLASAVVSSASEVAHDALLAGADADADSMLAALLAHAEELHVGSKAGEVPDMAPLASAWPAWKGMASTAHARLGKAMKELDLGAMMGGHLFRQWLDRAIDLVMEQQAQLTWLLEALQRQQQTLEQPSIQQHAGWVDLVHPFHLAPS